MSNSNPLARREMSFEDYMNANHIAYAPMEKRKQNYSRHLAARSTCT